MATKGVLDYWQFGTFFGKPAIQGRDRYRGIWIVQPYHWQSHGCVGLYGVKKRTTDYKLGIPHVTEPKWLSHAAFKKQQYYKTYQN